GARITQVWFVGGDRPVVATRAEGRLAIGSPLWEGRARERPLAQIYCGRIVRGLVIFLGSLLFVPAIVVAALLPPATVVLVGLILALLTVLGVYVFAVADAFRLARRGRDLFQSMDYNHPLVYALFILVGLTYSAGGVYFIRSSVFEAFAIPTASEVPTLLPG